MMVYPVSEATSLCSSSVACFEECESAPAVESLVSVRDVCESVCVSE